MSDINPTVEQNNTSSAATQQIAEIMEKVLLRGDLGKLEPRDRINYYNAICNSLGLNPLTKPFDYLEVNDGKDRKKLIIYANKSCTEQLRVIRAVSVTKLIRKIEDGLLTVEAHVVDATGRTDIATGAIWIEKENGKLMRGEELAVAYMKAETKAKRRATLSICGLGMLDESEIDYVKNTPNYDDNPQIDTNLVNVTLAKYSTLLDEAADIETLQNNFGEGWKALQKFKQRDGTKEAIIKFNQAYLEKKKLFNTQII